MEEAKVEDATSSGKVKTAAKEVLGGTTKGETAVEDQQKVEEAPPQEPSMVAQVEALATASPHGAISPDAPTTDAIPKASSSPAVS